MTDDKKTLPIWLADGGRPDEFAEFCLDTCAPRAAEYTLYVAADSEYNIYLDGALVGFGQYADYPGRIVYDTVVLGMSRGEHRLRILAWHYGTDSFTHVSRPAYLLFCLKNDLGEVVLRSCADTPSRPAPGYIPYKNHIITSQLGLGCEYSLPSAAQAESGAFAPSRTASVVDPHGERNVMYERVPRPVERLIALKETEMTVIRRGYYKKNPEAEAQRDAGLYMDSAILDVDAADADGCYLVADAGAEETGFIKFLLTSTKEHTVRIGWGEHLSEARLTPKTAVHSRRFTYICRVGSGRCEHTESMLRVGARYLEIFCEDSDMSPRDILYLGLLPVRYPVRRNEPPRGLSPLRERIYEAAVRTLELCMHVHYEDCPWREQSLYTMDSRTQMLCGYTAFLGGNTRFARANLDLISRSRRRDGLLSICAPAGIDRPIPCYSLAFILQLCEYAEFSSDLAFTEEKLSLADGIARIFVDRGRHRPDGLPTRFPDREGYWNYYEWSKTLEGAAIHEHTPNDELPAEAPLAAFTVMALSALSRLFALCAENNEERRGEYLKKSIDRAADAERISRAITQVFFDPKDRLFRSFSDRPDAPYAVLTQALCLLAGAAKKLDASRVLAAVAENRPDTFADVTLIPATLSSAVFRFDALYAADSEKYLPMILSELDRDGDFMLQRGATTFWETIKGARDFGGAGSLCHGWSALAAIWYRTACAEGSEDSCSDSPPDRH